ncbi:MAG TPA: PfkB family carbohydrate kinase [Candidatus Sulfopaludibacter sp.]|jgi:fructokinase|nr:PfkB family carbohydrate kinase [Candidatus Sulfopaludibacter sp.]
MTIVSIGEILWDVFEDSEKLGGAPFNFAVHASRLGHRVAFVSAVGDDARGHAAIARARELGLSTEFIQVVPGAATGSVTVKVDAAGQPDFRIHRPAAYDQLQLTKEMLGRLAALRPEWLYYGTLYQFLPAGREQVRRLADALRDADVFYDVNLRKDSFTVPLVEELLATADVVKLNEDEQKLLAGALQFGWRALAITRGERGCSVWIGSDHADVPSEPVKIADTVGAGDAFAAAFLHALSQGWSAARAGAFANRLGGIVASRPGGVPEWSPEELEDR